MPARSLPRRDFRFAVNSSRPAAPGHEQTALLLRVALLLTSLPCAQSRARSPHHGWLVLRSYGLRGRRRIGSAIMTESFWMASGGLLGIF